MLKPVGTEVLRPGFCLPGALRNSKGEVLVPAGQKLTDAVIVALLGKTGGQLFTGSDWCETYQQAGAAARSPGAGNGTSMTTQRVSVQTLRVGMRLAREIFDPQGLLLLSAGTQITPRFLELLHQRGIQYVQLGTTSRDSIRLHTPQTQQLDQLLCTNLGCIQPPRSRGPVHRPRLAMGDLHSEAERGVKIHTESRQMLADVCGTLCKQGRSSSEPIQAMIGQFVDTISLDFDLLPMVVAMQNIGDDYLFHHSVSVAMLSMSIGAQMGFNREQVIELGMGGLLQDIGMLSVPEDIRNAPRALTANEQFEIRRHPIHTLELLEGLDGLPMAAKFVGYQVHERNDGSGYPRQRSGMLIHQYAKIVSIADSYTAMTRPRPHRLPVLPYEAAKTVLVDASQNKFDRSVVRAFLDCISLFPIGSFVELSDGSIARVLRSNPGHHTRPVVSKVDSTGNLLDEVIDLSRDTTLKVVHAIPETYLVKPPAVAQAVA